MTPTVSIGLMGTTPADVLRRLAPRVEQLGFGALWLNDVPGGDSLTGLRATAEVTGSLRLATGVIPVDRRPAASLDLSGLPPARTSLGIGSGAAAKPLGLVRDAVRALRERTSAEIVVGALGPRMRRMAAEESDGVLLNWLTPDAAGIAMRELDADAAAALRSGVRGVLYIRTIIEPAARAQLETEASKYGSFPSYAANFARLGFEAIDATIDDAEGLAAYLREPAGVDGERAPDEIVLRAITPNSTLRELESFVEHAAGWIRAD
ncbi:alkanesulfonate monooxygenase SsuD/methylene tetrahydromethanopterin reductase-like flavin-dependent oxidoreductase (luciferase family) [Agromyces terreus]|uniref:Alkanesulfonate monooxygenase SsuD/methylene tetrahydromethanopterin reductase-like flavin-dependent oxidoreductase (Luciferase family) n=1 Tax=Agromyces terreus TaxID=424795 RepID=A0A9X2H018_9MICO|nr:LLM class flavin-dependent oxidoreductase [Agromyces terreus]MCP2370671.1 alkanesulfonate monooxygenase SsuD/methylene tetrahydromethanopterin reductase-like flavin-dependent oxidoreductase (luciferase family) [Agromyces terreus]